MTPLPPGATPRRPAPTPRPFRSDRPGSASEHDLQRELGTTARADRFYDEQVREHLNPQMRDFVRRQQMFFLATSNTAGECDSTLRAGPPGFLEVLDGSTLAWPELSGNGVMASLGNISENPHVGILVVDFVRDTVGLHVNGTARLMEPAAGAQVGLQARSPAGRGVRLWVVVDGRRPTSTAPSTSRGSPSCLRRTLPRSAGPRRPTTSAPPRSAGTRPKPPPDPQ